MFNEEEDEFNLDNDPMDEFNLKSLYDESLKRSMEFAYSTIEEMGMELWLKSIPMNQERKLKILTNMIDWYEKREEYEKCSVLLKGKQSLNLK